MKIDEKIASYGKEAVWKEYLGFLDLSLEEYMRIQRRLMTEQLRQWSSSPLGNSLLHGKTVSSIDEFRAAIPLTEYEDYADILLSRREGDLPAKPLLWIETTWEGGRHPVKTAPYTAAMLETYRKNLISVLMLCTSNGRGHFDVQPDEKVLYGLAPLPYPTGLIPVALDRESSLEFLPHVKDALQMSFSERNKAGFKLGLTKGIDYFFGMGSVAYYISHSLGAMTSGRKSSSSSHRKLSLRALARLAHGSRTSKKAGRSIIPKDLFRLKGFVVAGTDNDCYKDQLTELWGVRPMEIFMGTEPTLIGTEIWSRNGMYFFPDACFYEFIPEEEMLRSLHDPDYQPRTLLMDEVQPDEKYEIVLSVFKGGAFMRYRVGDVYTCLGIGSSEDGTSIPRFRYVDRVPNVIDIAGFTRITENSINSMIKLSGLPICGWTARKEKNEDGHPFLHLYAELKPEALASAAVSREILRDHMSIYFKYIDHDYQDLKKILGMDPLEVTILRCGSFDAFKRRTGKAPEPINPSAHDISDLLRVQQEDFPVEWR